MANTNDPWWDQTFIYTGMRMLELRKRALEITVWDYGKYEANDFLGEVVLELATARLEDEPEWHPLTGHGEHRHIGYVNIGLGRLEQPLSLKMGNRPFSFVHGFCYEITPPLPLLCCLCSHLPVAMRLTLGRDLETGH